MPIVQGPAELHYMPVQSSNEVLEVLNCRTSNILWTAWWARHLCSVWLLLLWAIKHHAEVSSVYTIQTVRLFKVFFCFLCTFGLNYTVLLRRLLK